MAAVYVDNTNSFKLVGLTDRHGELVTDAAPSYVVVDKAGTVLTPEVIMPPIPGEPGNYRGFIEAAAPLVAGRSYRIKLDVNLGDGGSAHWEYQFTAMTRTS